MMLLSFPAPAATPRPARPSVCEQPVASGGTVMAYTQGLRGFASEHEQMTRMEVVRRLARIKGFEVGDEFAQPPPPGPVYRVPSDTLVGLERAIALGLRGKDDLFGGVVPHAFVATKAITHPLWAGGAQAPEGWNDSFAQGVAHAVLPGWTAFSVADARLAGLALLPDGPVRVKRVCETAGRGQTVVRDAAQLDACLATMDQAVVARDGLVLERNLTQVQTLSVGQVSVAGLVATYYGTQQLTRNNRGDEVYGGSDLRVVRGGFDALLARELPDAVRMAVEQALAYDSAATVCFPGFFASRINYDIAQGFDAGGAWCSGVLEQSWRAGGATGAEIAALELLRADPARALVHARCEEIYGDFAPLPADATLYFRGIDEQVGPLTKFARVLDNVDTP